MAITVTKRLVKGSELTWLEGDDNLQELADLSSTANGKGASQVGIEDSGGNFTATDVEGALAEIRTTAMIGAWGPISTATLSTSATAEFTGLDGTYDEYKFVFSAVAVDTDNVSLHCQIGTGAGPSWKTSAYYYVINNSSTSTYNGIAAPTSGSTQISFGDGLDGGAGATLDGDLRFNNLENNGVLLVSRFIYDLTASSGIIISQGIATVSAPTAITAVKFYASSGNLLSGTITLYGLQK